MSIAKYKAHIALISAATMWGLMSPIGKTIMENGVDSMSLATFRITGGAVCFWLTSLFTKSEKVSRKDIFLLFLAGMLSVVLNQGSFILGLSMTSPVDASIITTTAPIITMIIAAIFIKEPITWQKATGVIIGSIGALILVMSNGKAESKEGNILGDIICLTAQMSFSFYLVLFKGLISRYNVITLMKWMFLFAAIVYSPLLFKSINNFDFVSVTPVIWVGVAYVILFGTFIAYILMMIGQKNLRPTVVSMYNYVQPIVGATTSVIVGLATFSMLKGFAVALIFFGVYVVTQSKSRAQVITEQLNAERKK